MNRSAIRSIRWVAPAIPLIIWLIDRSFNLDIVWFRAINSFCMELPDILWANLSLLGNGWAAFALAFPLVLFAPRLLIAGVIAGAFTGVISKILKIVIDTPRPAGMLDVTSFHIIEQPLLHHALPSGHTMTAFGIAAAIYFCAPPAQRRKWLILFLLALAAGLSRIAVGAHWPEDVLTGMSFGILCGISGAALARKIPDQSLRPTAWPVMILYLGSLAAGYILLTTPQDFLLNLRAQQILVAFIGITWLFIIRKAIRAQPVVN